MHMAAGAELTTLNGVVYLFHLVSQQYNFFSFCYLEFIRDTDFLLFQPIENRTCLWPTSTLWMLLKYWDIHLWGKSSSTPMLLDKCGLPSDTIFSVLIVSDPTRMHIWTFQTLDTLAPPFPLGPSTWPLLTRTNCGSSAVKVTWSRAKRALEICSGMVPGAGTVPNGSLCQHDVITHLTFMKYFKERNNFNVRNFSKWGGYICLVFFLNEWMNKLIELKRRLEEILHK